MNKYYFSEADIKRILREVNGPLATGLQVILNRIINEKSCNINEHLCEKCNTIYEVGPHTCAGI